MKSNLRWRSAAAALIMITAGLPVQGQDGVNAEKKTAEGRSGAYEKQLEDYLRHYLVDEYSTRSAQAWNRDYSSPAAFIQSVAPNRQRWEKVLNPPALRKSGPLTKTPHLVEGIKTEWIELPLGMVSAQAILAFPKGASEKAPVPLMVIVHGMGGAPEALFAPGGYYQGYAKALLNAGYAVLAPMNLEIRDSRNEIERYARLAATSLPGIELVRLQNLLDVVLADTRIDMERVGMWGLSLGGMATMFWMPLEPRIKAGVVSAWFADRRKKMAVPDERYGSFSPNAGHAFFHGWLTEFTDSDVVSLIAPRPLMIQHGKKDKIAYWPDVVEEYNRSKLHYEKLNIPEKIAITLHEGGHQLVVEEGIRFLDTWLKPASVKK